MHEITKIQMFWKDVNLKADIKRKVCY